MDGDKNLYGSHFIVIQPRSICESKFDRPWLIRRRNTDINRFTISDLSMYRSCNLEVPKPLVRNYGGSKTVLLKLCKFTFLM